MFHHVAVTIVKSLIVMVVIVVGVLATNQLTRVQAQSNNNNLRQLLESLNERITEEAGFQIAFKFYEPIVEVEENWWYVPYSQENSEVSRGILEIGDDFICFQEGTSGTQLVRCTPFSNIAAVNYANLP